MLVKISEITSILKHNFFSWQKTHIFIYKFSELSEKERLLFDLALGAAKIEAKILASLTIGWAKNTAHRPFRAVATRI